MTEIARSKPLSLSIHRLIAFIILFSIVAIVPALIHNQFVTGPLVNAILLITCVLVGPMEAVIVGTIPSTIALTTGLLPLPLAPMVPFIIVSNGLFIAAFHYIQKKSFFSAIFVAAFLKFLFLYLSVLFIMQGMLAEQLVKNLSIMMSWPQFITAIIGGILAYGVIKVVKKYEK